MCGIVGYTGKNNGVIPILEGLSRLEYRGYDSSGIALKINQKIAIRKKEGKLAELKKLIEQENPVSHVGIGHTRWATHGEVTTDNAHPHGNEYFAVVHNGIIENATELKKDLIKENFEFKSQTDSEVFLVLLTKYHLQGLSTLMSISKAFQHIRGNSAFVIMEQKTDVLYFLKRSAPLVCGDNVQAAEAYVSSDPFALVGFAPRIYFPEDSVIGQAVIENDKVNISFFELDLKPSQRFKIQDNPMSLENTTKGSFDHFMLKEIYEQPMLVEKLAGFYLKGEGKEILSQLTQYHPSFFHITACGTAWHAGLLIKNFIESFVIKRCVVEVASEFRYRSPILAKDDFGIFISQSGETADTLACQELCLNSGLTTLSIVNVIGSTLFRNSKINLPTHAGVEIGVASTKAFTQQVLTGYLMAHALKGDININFIHQEFSLLSKKMDEVLSRRDEIKLVAQEIFNKKGFIFTGRGSLFPIALEGALKLKEIAYVHAEGYAAGELKHGPIALIDHEMVNIALIGDELFEKTLSNIEEVKARKGYMVIIGADNERLSSIGDHYIKLELKELPNLAPLLVNLVLQILSYEVAKLKGTDIDKPRNLAKSVTVE